MQDVDLNLLTALDALLAERSVTRAAQRLGLSPSAMSRTLSRLRVVTGDPLLVLAGRTLVATPYAEQISQHIHELARDARAALQPPAGALNVATLERTFIIRANDGFVDVAGGRLLAAVMSEAPQVRIHFVPKADKDAQPLREGSIDLEIGVLGTQAPELKTRMLFRDRFVGVCRAGHPLLKRITAARYAGCPHVVVSRKQQPSGPVDDALARLGLSRTIAMVVTTHANAIHIVRDSDLVGLVPHSCVGVAGMPPVKFFELPVRTPGIKVSAIWHPRLHADPAHRWLRDKLVAICSDAVP
jgi:DNA-binding transcriptional LysR family regulator